MTFKSALLGAVGAAIGTSVITTVAAFVLVKKGESVSTIGTGTKIAVIGAGVLGSAVGIYLASKV